MVRRNPCSKQQLKNRLLILPSLAPHLKSRYKLLQGISPEQICPSHIDLKPVPTFRVPQTGFVEGDLGQRPKWWLSQPVPYIIASSERHRTSLQEYPQKCSGLDFCNCAFCCRQRKRIWTLWGRKRGLFVLYVRFCDSTKNFCKVTIQIREGAVAPFGLQQVHLFPWTGHWRPQVQSLGDNNACITVYLVPCKAPRAKAKLAKVGRGWKGNWSER